MTAVAALSLGLASALGASGGAGVGGEASSGVVRVPLAKRRRALAPQWGRAQSTVEYFGEVWVGLPRQRLLVAFDTGSANLVLPSAPCRRPRLYDAAASTTAEPGQEEEVTLVYGTGQVQGGYARDRVCLEGLCATLRFVEATKLSEEPFGEAPFDGVLGLALPQLAEGPQFGFFDELVKQRVLRRNVFAFSFAANGSSLLLGDWDEASLASELVWAPLSKPGFWQVALQDLTIDGVPAQLCGPPGSFRGCSAALDSGTSSLAAPNRLARQLAQRLAPGADGRRPVLGFRLEEVDLELQLEPEFYLDELQELQLMAVEVPRPHGPLLLLGEPFLRKFYTVYDRERLRIGFALARQDALGGDGLTVN
ncbi:unnamed protein product [Effrenium voratum]|uniref:Peptidase A1 domain-containing protein n=1 Tax=Effrenium voratum TaxID=2562239 RepID=A0AA36MZJ0_9DINO|nr:unnamed protein product [Effrenium voratum]